MRRHLVAAMSVIGLSLAWGAPALAQTITVTSLLQQDQYVAGVDGATFELTLTVSDTLPDDARIAVTSYKRISTRQLVRDAVAGKLASPIDTALIEVTADDYVEGNTIAITVPIETVSRTKDALQLSASGIYPLAIGVQQDKTISTAIVTFIERLPDNQSEPSVSENLNLAVVGSINGAITLQPDGSSVKRNDDVTTLRGSIQGRVGRYLTIGITAEQTDYDSNLPGLDRSVFRIGTTIGFGSGGIQILD